MRNFAAVLIVLGSLTVACEPREEVKPETKAPESVAPARTPEPVVEALPMPVDEVDVEFTTARENFVKGDFDRTAEDLNNAATRVTALGETGGEASRVELKKIAGDLGRIAKDVKSGTLRDVTKFDYELAGVEHSLAKHHLRLAREAMVKSDLRAAGRELNHAANDVEGIGRHMGKSLDAETEQGLRVARDMGGKLMQGVEQSPADVEKATKDLERHIDRLAQEMRRHK